MGEMCKYIYAKDATDRLRTRAILCHIYHHSIHDNWYEARDLMLMSHLQDTVSHSDPLTQILYNRTMVQLGLCGFRHAEIRDAHNALLDIQLGNYILNYHHMSKILNEISIFLVYESRCYLVIRNSIRHK